MSREPKPCEIDLSEGVDDLDEISGDEQLARVWCTTHGAWEWHWCDLEDVNGREIERRRERRAARKAAAST